LSRISVIGLDGSPLSTETEKLLRRAEVVAGGRRHLEATGVEAERSAMLEGDLSEAMSRLGDAESAVVLASGDPGYFGIVRALSERFGSENLSVTPALSSVTLAFARAGITWDDAVTVSAHGREPRRAVNVCRAYPKVAMLTSPEFGPAQLADSLRGEGWERTLIVAERLGDPEERVFRGSAEEVSYMEWEDPNVVISLDPEREVGPKPWISGPERAEGWALPEEEFEHRSAMITKSEPRALALARIAPKPGDLIWDVGAGSGSLAVECARFGAATVAVERDPESCDRVRRNAKRHGTYVRLVEGEAPGALHELPEPDAVFIGGTGDGFEETIRLCASRARRAVVMTLIGLERVVPAGEILESCGFEVETTLLQTSKVKGVGHLHRLAAETPVFVVSGSRA
jgi:precorrin-6Y C5,15-methyltransferase (decarboxylating)